MNQNPDKIKELIEAIGAMAEVSASFYKALLANGIASNDAMSLTQGLIVQLLKR